jgi:hypothetical protein
MCHYVVLWSVVVVVVVVVALVRILTKCDSHPQRIQKPSSHVTAPVHLVIPGSDRAPITDLNPEVVRSGGPDKVPEPNCNVHWYRQEPLEEGDSPYVIIRYWRSVVVNEVSACHQRSPGWHRVQALC